MTPQDATAALHNALNAASLPPADQVKTLIDAGANVNAPDQDGLPMLLRVLSYSYDQTQPKPHNDALQGLLDLALANGADLAAASPTGRSASDLAARWQDGGLAATKLGCEARRRADPALRALVPAISPDWPAPGDAISNRDKDGFMMACFYGRADEVAYMLYYWPEAGGWRSTSFRGEGNTGLMVACDSTYDTQAIVQKLLAAGTDIDAHNVHGYTALVLAAEDNSPHTQTLLQAGADPTLCLQLLLKGNPEHEAVAALLALGADVQQTDAAGYTPLLRLLSRYQEKEQLFNPRSIQALLTAGADMQAQTPDGKSVADLFLPDGKGNRTRHLLAAETIRRSDPYLLANFTQFETHWPKTATDVTQAKKDAFIRFCRDGRDTDVHYYLYCDPAAVHWRGDDNITGLIAAAGNDKALSVITRLLNADADVNAIDNKGQSALHLAVQVDNNHAIVTALLEAGAAVTLCDHDGHTALDLAADRGDPTLLALLQHAVKTLRHQQEQQEIKAQMNLNARLAADPRRKKFVLRGQA